MLRSCPFGYMFIKPNAIERRIPVFSAPVQEKIELFTPQKKGTFFAKRTEFFQGTLFSGSLRGKGVVSLTQRRQNGCTRLTDRRAAGGLRAMYRRDGSVVRHTGWLG